MLFQLKNSVCTCTCACCAPSRDAPSPPGEEVIVVVVLFDLAMRLLQADDNALIELDLFGNEGLQCLL